MAQINTNNNKNPKTPEQHTATLMKQILDQLGYLNNTFGDVRATLDGIASQNADEKSRLTNAMSRMLDSLNKLGPEFRVAMKEAQSSSDILDALNNALNDGAKNGSNTAKDNGLSNPILQELVNSVKELDNNNEVRATAILNSLRDTRIDYTSSFQTLGETISNSITDAKTAIIDNSKSLKKSEAEKDAERLKERNLLDRLEGVIAGSKPVRSLKNTAKNFIDFSLLNNASTTKSELRRRIDLMLVKSGASELIVDIMATAILGLVFRGVGGKLASKVLGGVGKGAGKTASKGLFGGFAKRPQKWTLEQKNYARDLRNARFATNGTNATSNVLAVKESYSGMYRTANVGGKMMTQNAANALKAGKTVSLAGKIGKGALSLGKAATGGLIGLLAGEALGASANFATGLGADARVAHGISGAGQGALYGASIGSVIPGLGTAVGAGIGAVVGLIGGIIKGNSEKKKQDQALGKKQIELLEEIRDGKEEEEKKGWFGNLFGGNKDDDSNGNGNNSNGGKGGKGGKKVGRSIYGAIHGKPVKVTGGLDTGGFRVNTDNTDRTTVNRYLANNNSYMHLQKGAGYNTLYGVDAGSFATDSMYVNKGTLKTFEQFLLSSEGKKYQGLLSISSGTSTKNGPHKKGGDHNGGMALDLIFTNVKARNDKNYTQLREDLEKFGVRQVNYEVDKKGGNMHVHVAPKKEDIEGNADAVLEKDKKGNYTLKNAVQRIGENKDSKDKLASVLPLTYGAGLGSSFSPIPTGNDTFSAFATNNVLMIGDSPYTFG